MLSVMLRVVSPVYRPALSPCARNVTGLVDVRESPLLAAALQTALVWGGDLLPRPAFLRFVSDTQCLLLYPLPGDNVVLLRSGLLRHVER